MAMANAMDIEKAKAMTKAMAKAILMVILSL